MTGTYIIAEAGVNHNGSPETAKQLIKVASEAGADAIKFQTFKTEKLVTLRATKADYQCKKTEATESQFDMLKKLELSESVHRELLDYCNIVGIDFLSTPFDIESVEFLDKSLNLPIFKVPSGEITNAPLLLKVAQSGKPVILSTGMSTLGEIETALGVLAFGYTNLNNKPSLSGFKKAYSSDEGQKLLKEKVTLLHCTTDYPVPYVEVNLRAIKTMKKAFGIPVGFSDHTEGIATPIAAVALGAVVIEKHFTLDRNMPGPDHIASLEPKELKKMVTLIRQVEEALGSPVKLPTVSELKNKPVVRKSLVVSKNVSKGEIFTEENITVKRPGTGISPIHYWDWLGIAASKDYEEDEEVSP